MRIHLSKLRPNPIGTATIVAITVIFNVPITNAQIPYLGSEPVGFQSLVNKNSTIDTRVKNVIVSVIKVKRIPIVVKIEIAAIIPKIIGTILSLKPPF